jgi:hypothetical protein
MILSPAKRKAALAAARVNAGDVLPSPWALRFGVMPLSEIAVEPPQTRSQSPVQVLHTVPAQPTTRTLLSCVRIDVAARLFCCLTLLLVTQVRSL